MEWLQELGENLWKIVLRPFWLYFFRPFLRKLAICLCYPICAICWAVGLSIVDNVESVLGAMILSFLFGLVSTAMIITGFCFENNQDMFNCVRALFSFGSVFWLAGLALFMMSVHEVSGKFVAILSDVPLRK
ncbi:MAG: hypothetical protein WC797_04010 [Candidatus Paceibacterota bacterium]|jgi:hypothetical protein